MTVTIKSLEELSFRTLPALHQDRYDGWVLRWSNGGSRRANSVNALDPSTLPLADKVTYCEEWFSERRGPAIFRLTALTDPMVATELDDRGYLGTGNTLVMTADLSDEAADPAVRTTATPPDDWLRSVPDYRTAEAATVQRLRNQLTTSGGVARFAAIENDGHIAAIGVGIDLDGYTTIYNMNTAAGDRRRGHARAILNSLMACGRQSGQSRAVLQVTEENTPAIALYRNAGFETAYTYTYRQRG